MAEDKPFKTGVDDVAKYENEQRRDTYGPEHGSGDPHMNYDDKLLSKSETWKSHKSHGTVKPPKKA